MVSVADRQPAGFAEWKRLKLSTTERQSGRDFHNDHLNPIRLHLRPVPIPKNVLVIAMQRSGLETGWLARGFRACTLECLHLRLWSLCPSGIKARERRSERHYEDHRIRSAPWCKFFLPDNTSLQDHGT
jgi:hypothetical protein